MDIVMPVGKSRVSNVGRRSGIGQSLYLLTLGIGPMVPDSANKKMQ
jgi:hypothetical protein